MKPKYILELFNDKEIFEKGISSSGKNVLLNTQIHFKDQMGSIFDNKNEKKHIDFISDLFSKIIGGYTISEKEGKKLIKFLNTSNFWNELYSYLENKGTLLSSSIDYIKFIISSPIILGTQGTIGLLTDKISFGSYFGKGFRDIKKEIIDEDKKEIKQEFKDKIIERIKRKIKD